MNRDDEFNPPSTEYEPSAASMDSIDFNAGPSPSELEEGPTSSLENIIPMDNLKKGWFALSGVFMQAAAYTQARATQAYNSEEVQAIRQKTAEIVAPAWEKTCEVAAPIWEKTKETAAVALEKTKEGVSVASERMRPTIDTVRT